MDDLKENWQDGNTIHGSDINTIDAAINDLAELHTVGASYRALEGIRSDITSDISEGLHAGDVGIQWDAAGGKFRYVGMAPEVLSSNAFLCINNNNTFGQAPANVFLPITLGFWTDATDVRVEGYCFGKPDMWATVDSARIIGNWQHANVVDENGFTWKLTQSAAAWHHYTMSFTSSFYQLTINTGATIVPDAPGFQMGVIGDSYDQGFSGTPVTDAVAPGVAGIICAGMPYGEFAQFSGFDVWHASVYGTGYTAQSDFSGNGPYGSTQRLAKVAEFTDLDMLVFNGSVNDGPATVPTLVNAANAAWTAARVAQPNAPIVVVGLESYGTADSSLDARNTALKEAAIAHDDVDAFVDLRTPATNFISGTGHYGAPVGDGNADVFIGPDGVHLTHMGARHWGQHLALLLGRVALKDPRAA